MGTDQATDGTRAGAGLESVREVEKTAENQRKTRVLAQTLMTELVDY